MSHGSSSNSLAEARSSGIQRNIFRRRARKGVFSSSSKETKPASRLGIFATSSYLWRSSPSTWCQQFHQSFDAGCTAPSAVKYLALSFARLRRPAGGGPSRTVISARCRSALYWPLAGSVASKRVSFSKRSHNCWKWSVRRTHQ